jgi:hypothetical protein
MARRLDWSRTQDRQFVDETTKGYWLLRIHSHYQVHNI